MSPKLAAVLVALVGVLSVALGVTIAADSSEKANDATVPSATVPAQAEPSSVSTIEPSTTSSDPTTSSPTSTQPPSTAAASEPPADSETGVSEVDARTIEPGVKETGNSGTVAYGEGSCGPEQAQFWEVQLYEHEVATIVWGGPNNSATGLDIWPATKTNIHGSGEGRLAYASTEGEDTKTSFTAPITGVYPIVFDDSCGHPGPFHFTLTKTPPVAP